LITESTDRMWMSTLPVGSLMKVASQVGTNSKYRLGRKAICSLAVAKRGVSLHWVCHCDTIESCGTPGSGFPSSP